MNGEMTEWAQRLKQFVEYLQRERRVGPSAQHQYRSIVKDWIEFSLARGHDPAVFDQALVDTLLDHRAHRNSKGVLAAGSRLSYASNLKVFCEWASAERPRASSQIWIESWQGPLPSPIDALEQLLQQGSSTIVRAAFQYSFFAHPTLYAAERRGIRGGPGPAGSTTRAATGATRHGGRIARSRSAITRTRSTHGPTTRDARSSGGPGSGFVTSGATLGIPAPSPLAGTCATCRSGRGCSLRSNIRIHNLKRQSVKPRGICTSGLIRSANHPNS